MKSFPKGFGQLMQFLAGRHQEACMADPLATFFFFF